MAGQPPIRRTREMQLEINAEGVDAVVSRVLQPRNAHDDRQQADRDTGAPLRVSELVAMVGLGVGVIKASTAGRPGGHCSPSPRTVRVLHRRRLGTKRDARNTQPQCRSRQGRDARRRSRPDAPVPPELISHRRPRWILSGHRNSADAPCVCARHMAGHRYAHPVSCPYARCAYACPVPAGHMRLICWRLARSVRVCRCPTRQNLGGDAAEETGEQP